MRLPALLLYFLIAMSPTAIDAFSQIARVKILAGTMDLQDTGAMIEAVGQRDGALVQVRCKWQGGYPLWVVYQILGMKI